MRILTILAVIAATATPALAHRDIKDHEIKTTKITSAAVEKSSFNVNAADRKAKLKSGRLDDR